MNQINHNYAKDERKELEQFCHNSYVIVVSEKKQKNANHKNMSLPCDFFIYYLIQTQNFINHTQKKRRDNND